MNDIQSMNECDEKLCWLYKCCWCSR